MQLLCCEAHMRDAIQDRYGRRGCTIIPDDALHLDATSVQKNRRVLEVCSHGWPSHYLGGKSANSKQSTSWL